MNNTARKTIGRNVRTLRKALDLSQIRFAELTGISRATLINIESGRTGYNLNLIDQILDFADYKIEDLSRENFIVDDNLRENLANKYKNNSDIYVILNRRPSIKYAIEYKLLKSNFIIRPKEINEITDFFEKYGWHYLGTSIQNELKTMSDTITIEPHPTKKGTNLYSRKR